jgi:hypothetical protein
MGLCILVPFLLPACGEKVPKADEGPAERRKTTPRR